MFASEPYSRNNFSLAKSMIFPGWGELSEYKRYQKEYILDRSRAFNYIEGNWNILNYVLLFVIDVLDC